MTAALNILAATDFSEAARPALLRAVQLASQLNAELTVQHGLGLHRFGALPMLPDLPQVELEEKLREAAQQTMRTLLQGLDIPHGLTVHPRISDDPAPQCIAQTAEALQAELLVIGAHGHGFFERLLLGSTTTRLLRSSRSPVLVARRDNTQPYQRILLACDFSSSSAQALDLARQLAPQASLVLMHVFEIPLEGMLYTASLASGVIERIRGEARVSSLKKLHELAVAADLPDTQYSESVVEGDPARQILEQAERLGCDLIVLGKHGQNRTEDVLLGSVTKRVLAASPADILVVSGP